VFKLDIEFRHEVLIDFIPVLDRFLDFFKVLVVEVRISLFSTILEITFLYSVCFIA